LESCTEKELEATRKLKFALPSVTEKASLYDVVTAVCPLGKDWENVPTAPVGERFGVLPV